MANEKVDVGAWISEAFDLYKANFGLFCVAGLVAALLSVLTCGILSGPMWAGLTLIILRTARKEDPSPQIGDVFKGFDLFLQAFLLALVLGAVFFLAGSVAIVGPLAGVLVSPLVVFSMCLLADRNLEFWPAIVASYEKAKTDYLSLLVLCLLGSLISGLGALLCGIGIILTAPFSAVVAVVAYRHLFEGEMEEAVPAAADEPPPPPPVAPEGNE